MQISHYRYNYTHMREMGNQKKRQNSTTNHTLLLLLCSLLQIKFYLAIFNSGHSHKAVLQKSGFRFIPKDQARGENSNEKFPYSLPLLPLGLYSAVFGPRLPWLSNPRPTPIPNPPTTSPRPWPLSYVEEGDWSECRWVRLLSCAPQALTPPVVAIANAGHLRPLLHPLSLLFFLCGPQGPLACLWHGAHQKIKMWNRTQSPHPLR